MCPRQFLSNPVIILGIQEDLSQDRIYFGEEGLDLYNLALRHNQFQPDITGQPLSIQFLAFGLRQTVEPSAGRGVAAPTINSQTGDFFSKCALSDFAKVGAEYFGQFWKHIPKIYERGRRCQPFGLSHLRPAD
jgi:hypothetical protein